MKKLIVLVFACLIFLGGCASSITPENLHPPQPPSENIPSENLPNTDNIIPPIDVPKPTLPQKELDRLVKINDSSLALYNNRGKYVGTVYKNDLLPIFNEDKYYYYSKFNHQVVGVKKSSNVSIKTFEKSSKSIENVIDIAKQILGTKYVYGAQRYHFGNGNKNSKFNKYYFDCSSLVQYAYFLGNGTKLAMTSREQSKQGKYISKANIIRGDLLYFTNSSRKHLTGTERIGHVAIYLGDNYILHTASDYAIIEPISQKRWQNFELARRVI